MTEKDCKAIAKIVEGEPWQSGGNVWVVVIRRDNGSLVMMSDECVSDYKCQKDADQGLAIATIYFF